MKCITHLACSLFSPNSSALPCYFNPEQEAYQGPETSCDVTGLPSNSQLVFCVKVNNICRVCGCILRDTHASSRSTQQIIQYKRRPRRIDSSRRFFCFPLPCQALYDDQRFLWSEPLMVTTAAKGGPRAKQQ